MLILQSLYYFLPAYVSNMAPVILKKVNILPFPVDLNKKIYGKPIFGKNKSWGGLLYGTLAGTLIFWIQKILYDHSFFREFALFNYNEQPLLLGFLLASGAILGDLGKSFVKRRLGKKPGEHWFLFDQTDLVFGAFLFSFFVYIPSAATIITILVLTPVLHYTTNYIGYILGLKVVKW